VNRNLNRTSGYAAGVCAQGGPPALSDSAAHHQHHVRAGRRLIGEHSSEEGDIRGKIGHASTLNGRHAGRPDNGVSGGVPEMPPDVEGGGLQSEKSPSILFYFMVYNIYFLHVKFGQKGL
jgi:hypothetical protein